MLPLPILASEYSFLKNINYCPDGRGSVVKVST